MTENCNRTRFKIEKINRHYEEMAGDQRARQTISLNRKLYVDDKSSRTKWIKKWIKKIVCKNIPIKFIVSTEKKCQHQKASKDLHGYIIGGHNVNHIRCADDTVLIAHTEWKL